MNNESMLQEAAQLIDGPRAESYGDAYTCHLRIARMWSVILGVDVTPEQVVMCMIGTKLCRLIQSPEHRDSWVDIAGYVGVNDLMSKVKSA